MSEKEKQEPVAEQQKVLENDKKNMIVSASAGSGKTYIMIKYISKLICEKRVPVEKLLVLTFTKSAAIQMKDRLLKELKSQGEDEFIIEQIDSLSTANISTIDSFCEKMLRKYAHFLNLNQNFEILDENSALKLKKLAFSRAIEKFEQTEDFKVLQIAFRANKETLENITFKIENLVDVLPNKQEFLEKNIFSAHTLFDNACEYIKKNLIKNLQNLMKRVRKEHLDDFEEKLFSSLKNILESKDIIDLAKNCEGFAFPALPTVKEVGKEVVDRLNSLKKKFVSEIEKIRVLNLLDSANVDFQKAGVLEKSCIKLFQIFGEEQNLLKKSQNCLDFADLENYMTELSKKHELFAGLEYVFVDEYQDTNRIQEKIVKNVAKNCNFVAVGDVKQGIYGFRLASTEIFLQDLKDFEKDEDSAVALLTTNFRSSKQILDFVNSIFSACMTENLTGVDYKQTSMLKEFKPFSSDGQKSIYIDVCKPVENPVEENPKIYSVKDAHLFKDRKNENLLFDIKRRIFECLKTKISDEGQLRPCKFSDITILTRKRTPLFDELDKFLRESGIPVVSNSSEKLMDQPEIQMLANYLKLAVCFDDDVALLSVLLGGLYRFSAEDIASEKTDDKTLCECVLEDKNQKFGIFNKDLSDFKLNFQIFGIKKAFEILFAKTNFRAYINLYNPKLDAFVEAFLNHCELANFDLAELANFFETVPVEVKTESAMTENAVRLTTIHDSKGLEYPIVFVIGCDNSLSKVRTHEVEINDDFGLAVKTFDFDENTESISARMMAIRQTQKEKSFSEEMMLFYVALTRAKNRLYLFGLEQKLDKTEILDCDTYFDFIFYALPKIKESLLENGCFEDENVSASMIDSVEQIQLENPQNFENSQFSPSILQKIEDYLAFSYKFSDSLNFRMKESVTNLSKKNEEDLLGKYANENFSFSSNAVEIGNAYHMALRCIDFDKVCDLSTLEKELQKFGGMFDESLIDKKVLLENILKLKEVINKCSASNKAPAKIFKEKEFVMKEQICNLIDEKVGDKILVQGVVDLFVDHGDFITLVDYKYSSTKDASRLIERYKNQLKFYKIALENAFNKPVKKVYLLSLKDCNLIEVNNF